MSKRLLCMIVCILMCIMLIPAAAMAAEWDTYMPQLTIEPEEEIYLAVPGTQVRFDITVDSTSEDEILLYGYKLYLNGASGVDLTSLETGWPKYTEGGIVDPVIPQVTGYFYITLDEDMCKNDTLSVKMTLSGRSLKLESHYYDTNEATASAKLAAPVTVTFDGNGAVCDPESVIIPAGTKVKTSPSPEKEGYNFGGWADKENKQVYLNTAVFEEDTTLYAIWKPVLSDVTFGLGDPEEGKTVADYKDLSITDPALTKDTDWDSPNADPVLWFEQGIISAGDYPDENKALPDSHVLEGGKTYTVVLKDIRLISRDWDTEGVTGHLYGDDYTTMSIDEANNSALFYFEVTVERAPLPDYTVTFDENGHGTAPDAQTVEEGGKAEKPADLEEEGYTFDGWFADEECEEEFDFDAEIHEDTTVYAKWTKDEVIPPPQTGDSNGIYLWSMAVSACAAALSGIMMHNGRRKEEE